MYNSTERKIADYIDEQQARRTRKNAKKMLKPLSKQLDQDLDGTRYIIDSESGEIAPYHRKE